jgi:hypothetical protein
MEMEVTTKSKPTHGNERKKVKKNDLVADYPIYPKDYQPPEVDEATDWRTWVYGGAKNPKK